MERRTNLEIQNLGRNKKLGWIIPGGIIFRRFLFHDIFLQKLLKLIMEDKIKNYSLCADCVLNPCNVDNKTRENVCTCSKYKKQEPQTFNRVIEKDDSIRFGDCSAWRNYGKEHKYFDYFIKEIIQEYWDEFLSAYFHQPCAGCKNGHNSMWQTIVESPQWKEWEKVGRYDFAECDELGIMSQGHFQAFLEFCRHKTFEINL